MDNISRAGVLPSWHRVRIAGQLLDEIGGVNATQRGSITARTMSNEPHFCLLISTIARVVLMLACTSLSYICE